MNFKIPVTWCHMNPSVAQIKFCMPYLWLIAHFSDFNLLWYIFTQAGTRTEFDSEWMEFLLLPMFSACQLEIYSALWLLYSPITMVINDFLHSFPFSLGSTSYHVRKIWRVCVLSLRNYVSLKAHMFRTTKTICKVFACYLKLVHLFGRCSTTKSFLHDSKL